MKVHGFWQKVSSILKKNFMNFLRIRAFNKKNEKSKRPEKNPRLRKEIKGKEIEVFHNRVG